MLSALGTIWAGVWLLATTPTEAPSLSSLTALAAVALFAALTAGAMRRAAAAASRHTFTPALAAARWAKRHDGVPRLSDPDAAGRPRPRAPSANQAA